MATKLASVVGYKQRQQNDSSDFKGIFPKISINPCNLCREYRPIKNGTMSKAFYLIFLFSFLPLFCFSQKKDAKNNIVLVIDPGHGGKDPGKPKNSTKYKHEKDLNLLISKKFGDYIEKYMDNVTVLYTRSTDVFVSLEERVDFANRQQADYFISIHCNSNKSRFIHGTKTHIHSHNFKTSKALALRIEQEFKNKAGRLSKGVMSSKDRGYNLFVVQYSKMPSVLVETGFMTNANEEKYLNSVHGQDILASALFRAFRDFVTKKHAKELRNKYYRVQILASDKQVPLSHPQFDKLGLKVEESKSEDAADKFPYKYLVGREYDLDAVKLLVKKIKKLGYKDAFHISVQEK